MVDETSPTRPRPNSGWSKSILSVPGAYVIPPTKFGYAEPGGVLSAAGRDVWQGAIWRRHRRINEAPEVPNEQLRGIEGTWLWGGLMYGHFGHFLLESLSRMWAVNHVRRQDIRGILFIPKRPGLAELEHYQRDLLAEFAPGVPVHILTRPARIRRLLVPGQGFGMGQMSRGTNHFRRAVHMNVGQSIAPKGPKRIYISRARLPKGRGNYLHEDVLEQRLSEAGYTIIHPEKMSIREQIAHYKAADYIIGADGSALHLFAYVGRPHQQVAMILRRVSWTIEGMEAHIREFTGCRLLRVNALKRTQQDEDQPSHTTLSELSFEDLQAQLVKGGFLPDGGLRWTSPDPVLPNEEIEPELPTPIAAQ